MTNDNTPNRKIQAREKIDIPPHALVNFKAQGNRYAEVVYMTQGTPKPTIKPLGDNRYMVLKSGEIKEFGHNDHKQKDTLKKTFAALKGILRANFDAEGHNQLFVTLTYKENMTDPERLYEDFKYFWKKLKAQKNGHHLEYVTVAEPQARGAWHMHVMIKSDQPVLYIDKEDMSRIWGHGYTTTERLKGDDVGAYYVSYFTSLEIEEQTVVKRKNGSKRYKKGARLPMYPLKFKLFRCSKGIIKPMSEYLEHQKVTGQYGEPYRTSTYDIQENDETVNTIQLESFKKPGDTTKTDT